MADTTGKVDGPHIELKASLNVLMAQSVDMTAHITGHYF